MPLLTLLGSVTASLSASPSTLIFTRSLRTPGTIIVTGGIPPYFGYSGNLNVATLTQAVSPNLVQNADLLNNWTLGGSLALGNAGPNGSKDIGYTGTGSSAAGTNTTDSPSIVVIPSTGYALSVWVDPSHITSGQCLIAIKDLTNGNTLHSTLISSGTANRFVVNWTTLSNTTSVAVHLDLNGCTVTSGQLLKFSQPMLTLNGVSTATYLSPSCAFSAKPLYPGSATLYFYDSATDNTTATATFIGTPSFPDLLKVGSVNRKALAFIGLSDNTGGTYRSSIYPQGTYMLTDTTGKTQIGEVTQTVRGYDLSKEFDFDVFGGLPHPLYGRQNDVRYDSNYNLKNPSSDLKTYVCDGKFFMQVISDNPFLASAFQSVFNGGTAPPGGVNVYVGTPTAPSSTVVPSSAYTWNASTGTVVFNTAQAANAVVSVDGVPQGMAPETMLYHLFNDYGGYSPANFNFNTTNLVLPSYVGGGGKTVWEIAQDIANATAPRAVKWRLRMDEFANILFYEDKYADQPIETLIDERDFLQLSYTQTDNQLSNVVRAEAESNNEQHITSISYDIDSISQNGQRKTDDISTQSFLALRGLPPLQVKSFLDAATAVELHDKSRAVTEINATLLANPARQVGDKVTVVERANGLSGPYIIKGLTDTIQEQIWTQTVRLSAVRLYANYNMGLASAITNGAAPGTTGDLTNQKINVSGRTGIIKSVTIGGTNVIINGGIVYDVGGNPVIPIISGGTWPFSFTLDSSQQYDTTVYQFLYFECPNTLSSTDIMAIRLQNWLTNDGLVITAATVAAGYTQTSTHTTGTALGTGERAYLYGNLVYPAFTNSLSPNYPSQMTTLSWITSTGLTGAVGAGLGPYYTGTYAYLPQAKFTYGFYAIVAYNSAGATSILRIPCVISC